MTRQTSFVLTNRMNLNTILSTRIVGPRALFTKYYPDPLEITGNAVALLGSPPDAAFVASVAATTRVGPVLLEIARPASDAVDLVPAVPFSKVVAVHMPSERVAREHLARRYANIHPHGELVQVSPDLFDGTCSEDDVRKAAAGASASAPFVPPVDWGHIDRLRGARGANAGLPSLRRGDVARSRRAGPRSGYRGRSRSAGCAGRPVRSGHAAVMGPCGNRGCCAGLLPKRRADSAGPAADGPQLHGAGRDPEGRASVPAVQGPSARSPCCQGATSGVAASLALGLAVLARHRDRRRPERPPTSRSARGDPARPRP
jgi:hypothetical protein